MSRCPCKEAYALFLQDNPLIPRIEHIGYQKYLMPYYPRIKSYKEFNLTGQMVYKVLENIFKYRVPTGYHKLHDAFSNSELPANIVEDLISILDAVSNYIDPDNIRFEISRRNVTKDKNNNIILQDCFFDCRLI
jgi:hypothetical protein